MSDKEIKPSHLSGCVAAVLGVFLSLPIWFILLHGILTRTEAPAWQWVLFVMYVPSQLLGSVLAHGTRMLANEKL